MKLSTFSLLAVCALGLSGCGKFLDKFGRLRDGHTLVSFTQGGPSLLSPGLIRFEDPIHHLTNVNGGVMVYAVADDGKVYSTSGSSHADNTIKLTLPKNTTYSFYGVGWPTSGMEADPLATPNPLYVRCGSGGSKLLTADSETVTLDLRSDTECRNANEFWSPSYALQTSPESTISPLSLIFCGKSVDVSSKAASGAADETSCLHAESSSYFFKGSVSMDDVKMDRAEYFPALDTLMFTATRDSGGLPYLLYRYDGATGKQTKVSMPYLSGGMNVKHLKRVPGQNKLLYLLSINGTQNQLWLYELDNGSIHRLSHAAPPNVSSPSVEEFRVTDDGDYVIFVGDMDTEGVDELYSVPIDDSTYGAPTRISGALASPGVKVCGSCGGDDRYYFEIRPGSTNPFVVFSAVKALANRYDLHFASLDGAAMSIGIQGAGATTTNSGTIINQLGSSANGFPEVAGDYIDHPKFSPDGKNIVFHAYAGDSDGTPGAPYTMLDKILHLRVTDSGASVLLTTENTVFNNYATQPFVVFSNDLPTSKAAFTINASGTLSVGTVDLGSTLTNNYMLMDITGIANPGFSQVEFSPNNAYVVAAAADMTTPGSPIVESLKANVASPGSNYGGTVIDLADGLLGSGKKIKSLTNEGNGHEHFLFDSGSSNKVIFIANLAVATRYQLHFNTMDVDNTATDISGSAVDTDAESVKAVTQLSDGSVFFLAHISSDPSQRLYKTSVAAAPTVQSIALPTEISQIDDLSSRDEDFTSQIPLRVRRASAPEAQETYLFSPGASPAGSPSTAVYERVSRIAGGSQGLGRFEVSVLEAEDGVSFTPAFTSACYDYSTGFDGEPIETEVRVPLGNGSTTPIRTKVTVYPLAESCSGSSVSWEFPNGIGGAAGDYGPTQANVTGSGSMGNLRLFLREQ